MTLELKSTLKLTTGQLKLIVFKFCVEKVGFFIFYIKLTYKDIHSILY
jgi:hypothetical protein